MVNTSTSETIDLTGVRFEEGIDYSFADRTQLAPGDRVVIGQSQFAGGSRLADGGERLTLVDGGGSLIFDFRYRDGNPWPESADGGGFSLVRTDFSPGGDLDDPHSWRPSVDHGGSPGGSDSQPYAGGSLLDYALAGGPMIEHRGAKAGISYRYNLAADQVALTLETAADLAAWEAAGGELAVVSRVNHGDGTETLRFETAGPVPFEGAPEMFVRLRVSLR